MNPCLLIPCYNHSELLAPVLEELAPLDLPCIVIDDGSDAANRERLAEPVARHPWVRLEVRSTNGGKGAALKDGYRLAASLGYTHVLQLDADGQHDTADIPRFLELAKARPDALILVQPVLENAPRSRQYGRLISSFWVWIECLSFAIGDPLCGFRCLPLTPVIRILDRVRCGDRMDFDPEIAVRLVWEGVPVINVPSRVTYGSSSVSHFDLWWDNVRISWRHSRLVCGMLLRTPLWLWRRVVGTGAVS